MDPVQGRPRALPGGFAGNQGITGWAFERGTIARKSFFWDNETSFALAFDGTYVYQGGTTGVAVYTVGPAASGYPLSRVGGLSIADASGGTRGILRALSSTARRCGEPARTAASWRWT